MNSADSFSRSYPIAREKFLDAAKTAGGACERLQRHVLRHLVDGAPLENGAGAYLRNLRIQEAVYASSAEGRRIALDEFEPQV